MIGHQQLAFHQQQRLSDAEKSQANRYNVQAVLQAQGTKVKSWRERGAIDTDGGKPKPQTQQQDSAKGQYQLRALRHLVTPGKFDRFPIVDFPTTKESDSLKLAYTQSNKTVILAKVVISS